MPDTPEQSLADRMYPATAETPPASAPPADTPAAEGEPTPTQPDLHADAERPTEQVSVDDLVDAEQDVAERLYAQGGAVPDEPGGYQHALGERFDDLEHDARHDAREEDIASLAAGRAETAAMLHELQVPTGEAAELTRTLGDWFAKAPMDEDANWEAKAQTIDQLEAEWGQEAQARVALAQRTSAEACKRLPWLGDLLRSGAGNDPKLIKAFAEIGLRQARRQRPRAPK